MLRYIYNHKGITLVEFLAAAIIAGLVIGSVIAIYLMGATAWKEGATQISLQREASIAMEKMVRGVENLHGIREATSATVTGGSAINYTSDVKIEDPPKERSFSLSSGEIEYDPNTASTNDEFSIAENVSGLTFTISDDVVTINLSMAKTVRDREIKVDLDTHVKLRN